MPADLPNDMKVHYRPLGASDRFALATTKFLRLFADTFFAKKYGHRAVVLETVAAVPGMVGATLNHLKCLRRMEGVLLLLLLLADAMRNTMKPSQPTSFAECHNQSTTKGRSSVFTEPSWDSVKLPLRAVHAHSAPIPRTNAMPPITRISTVLSDFVP